MRLKPIGQHCLRHVQMVKTVRLLAHFAIEMRMLILIVVLTVAMAQLIPRTVAATFDSMYQMMLLE
jgi:hypothetical protein